jgi:ubiquinone/menaquinone biosynthesis C-methylase UbiE
MIFAKFFYRVQETDWYRDFLSVVTEKVSDNAKVLDIGTGTGKFLEMLQNMGISNIYGVDTNASMVQLAIKRMKGTTAKVLQSFSGESLDFRDHSFDHVCISNLLFNLSREQQIKLLKDSMRLLSDNGSIIIFNPAGKSGILPLLKKYKMPENYSLAIWHSMTLKRSKTWAESRVVQDFCKSNNLSYYKTSEFHGYATLEIIGKNF